MTDEDIWNRMEHRMLDVRGSRNWCPDKSDTWTVPIPNHDQRKRDEPARMYVSRRVDFFEVVSRSRRPRDPYRSGIEEIVLVLRRSRYSYSYSNGAPMTEPIFDHDRLDVYRLSIDYVASSFAIAKDLNGLHRHARDQWLRAAQSIPLNIAEGNGKRSLKDRNRFLDIARGSALECASIQDVLAATDGLDDESHGELKRMLKRIVSMLTRLIGALDVVSESSEEYNAAESSTSTAMLSTSTSTKKDSQNQELHRRTRRRCSPNQCPPRVLGEFNRYRA